VLVQQVVDERRDLVERQLGRGVRVERLPVIRREVAAAVAEAGDLLFACVGCTGAMDRARGRVLFSSVFPDDFDLAAALGFRCSVVIENDCNLAVIAERWRGAAVGLDDVVCVLTGERIGAGIMVGGNLMRGHRVVVIGGGVARAGDVLLAPLRSRLERMVRRPPRLVASPLAERGPLLGAIRLALDELEPTLLAGLEDAA
jgi:predicted NBD/HSP70 family sugar kinase